MKRSTQVIEAHKKHRKKLQDEYYKKKRFSRNSVEDYPELHKRVDVEIDHIAQNMFAHPDKACAQKDYVACIRSITTLIRPRMGLVLNMRYFEGATYAQCGKAIGVSVSQARAIHDKALRMLRHPTRLQKIEQINA
jgi:DNA-directed RNA polymerase sigma subunit (sigma70/sigma32)